MENKTSDRESKNLVGGSKSEKSSIIISSRGVDHVPIASDSVCSEDNIVQDNVTDLSTGICADSTTALLQLPPPLHVLSPTLFPEATSSSHRVSSHTIFSGEQKSSASGRILQISQKKFRVVGGGCIQTRIEVADMLLPNQPIVFSVKHSHDKVWERQLVVHRNVLLACILSGVSWSPLEVPHDSRKMFEITDNPHHMHSYLERVLPHVRYAEGLKSIKLFWWRAINGGSIILLNEITGRLKSIPNKQGKLTGAAGTIVSALNVLRRLSMAANDESIASGVMSQNEIFLDPDSDYPTAASINPPDPEQALPISHVKQLIQRWAVEKGVSPWLTKLVVRSYRRGQLVNFRYSLDVDVHQELTATPVLAIQVHLNEPLSRELQAYPICQVPIPLNSTKQKDIYLQFSQALWFTQKLFEVHRDSLPMGSKDSAITPDPKQTISQQEKARNSSSDKQRRSSVCSSRTTYSCSHPRIIQDHSLSLESTDRQFFTPSVLKRVEARATATGTANVVPSRSHHPKLNIRANTPMLPQRRMSGVRTHESK